MNHSPCMSKRAEQACGWIHFRFYVSLPCCRVILPEWWISFKLRSSITIPNTIYIFVTSVFTFLRSKGKYCNCRFHLLLSLLLCSSVICPMLQKLFSQANVIGHHVWPDVTDGTRCDQLWPIETRCDQILQVLPGVTKCDQLWPDVTRCDQMWHVWPVVTCVTRCD